MCSPLLTSRKGIKRFALLPGPRFWLVPLARLAAERARNLPSTAPFVHWRRGGAPPPGEPYCYALCNATVYVLPATRERTFAQVTLAQVTKIGHKGRQ